MGARGAAVRGWVAAPFSMRGAPGAAGRGAPGAIGRGAEGAPGAIGRGAAGAPGDNGMVGAIPEGAGGITLRPGGGIGAGGNEIGLVAALGEGGGSGAEGNWIGAVTRRAAGGGMGAERPGGGKGTPGAIGEVASRGCVVPAPGRARRVMRTVSFFSGTAEVFCVPVGTAAVLGVGGVLSASLIKDDSNSGKWIRECYLADRRSLRQFHSPGRNRISKKL
ncbi:MAG: hypothetical protein JWO08_1380 [Verrucomicrobiaceae bacterium]|nr:hypothetical protein [Verrucomicrobiaceae bacterium]